MTVLVIEPGPAAESELLTRPGGSALVTPLSPRRGAKLHSLRPTAPAGDTQGISQLSTLDRPDFPEPSCGLARAHLVDRIAAGDPGRVVTVTGPAGSGKTQLLAQSAAAAAAEPDRVVAWFAARPEDNTAEGVCRAIDRAVSRALDEPPADDASAEDVTARLTDSLPGVTVFIDDEHYLHKAEARDALSQIISTASHRTTFVLGRRFANRRQQVSRAGSVTTEICAGDLRFSEEEVARLFAELYGRSLPTAEIADLTTVTGGWITGLHFFQQSTVNAEPEQRARAITRLWGQSALVRRYLDHNVIGAVPDQVSGMLIHTSLLPTLSAELCDLVLGTGDSAEMLRWLADRDLFIDEVSPGCYRLDDFFREYLSHRLADAAGAPRMRALQLQSALLLEGHGVWRDAFRAFTRLGDWSAGTRVLQEWGIAGPREGTADPDSRARVPGADEDAGWSALAQARQRLVLGDFAAAARLQTEAAEQLRSPIDREYVRAENLRIQAWTAHSASPAAGPVPDWAAALRQLVCTGRPPADVHTGAAGGWHLVSAMSSLLAGRVEEALQDLRAADVPDNTFVPIAARTAHAAVTAITDPDAPRPDWTGLRTDAEAAGFPWLSRICLALAALNGNDSPLCAPEIVRQSCESDGDTWGSLICDLIVVLTGNARDSRDRALQQALLTAETLGVSQLVQWIGGIGELGSPATTNAPLPSVASSIAEATAAESPTRTEMTASNSSDTPAITEGETDAPPPLEIRCLGAFSLRLNGNQLDCSQLRPRARSLLRYLAANAGRPVHEETLMEEFWPASPSTSARHNLHVAISAIRGFIDRHRPGSPTLLVRRGETYLLALPDGSRCDVTDLETGIRRCRQLRVDQGAGRTVEGSDALTLTTSLRATLSLYHGQLLEDEGPAEWLSTERPRLQSAAVKLCADLAGLELSAGNIDAAIDAAHRGIEIDRMNDACWRLLIQAHERRGDFASAQRTRTGYGAVLADLGIRC